jgi:hypothetical protein
VVRPDTPLGQLLTVARADTRRAETPAAALDALAAVLELETFLERTTDDLALAARRDGATWEQIGSALGTSRQAAQQRWGNISRFAGWEAVEEANAGRRRLGQHQGPMHVAGHAWVDPGVDP